MTISSPYRFVPLSDLVVLPDWAGQVSHDVPFEDGVCGELTLTLTNHTRLCVGGEQVKYQDKPPTPTRVKFYRTAQNKLAIPGSSLKGMLRNVLEIATFSRFKQVEDQKLGVRDISSGKNFYTEAIVRKPVQAGWMNFEEGAWKIYPCDFARLHQKDLIKELSVSESEWTRLKTASDRYKKIGICPQIKFKINGKNTVGQKLAEPHPTGSHEGRIVVTGQPGRDFRVPRAKKWEFIFFNQQEYPLDIAPDVMAGFNRIHAESKEWLYWKNILKASSNDKNQSIPVFFHQDDDQSKVVSLGLAMMYKLPYKYSIHDAIKHTSNSHLEMNQPDFADLVFGYLAENGTNGLRGRVNIGMAQLITDATPIMSIPTVLSSPKPTYYPFYMLQNGKNFRQLMEDDAELSGWKRYQVKPEKILPPPDKSTVKVQVQLEVLPENCQFSFKILFHNLRPVELGALVWSLDFGGNTQACHVLGMGKPYGLGQISLKTDNIKIRHNSSDITAKSNQFLADCQHQFIEFMQDKISVGDKKAVFAESVVIKSLIKYGTPSSEDTSFDSFDYIDNPQDFMKLRNNSNLSLFKKHFHHPEAVNRPSPKVTRPNNNVQQNTPKIQPTHSSSNQKPELSASVVVDVAALQKKIDAIVKKNNNPQYSNAFYLLEQLSKAGVFHDAEKNAVAQHIKTMMINDTSWQENSSSDKKERKKYDKTMEVKRFL